MNDTTFYAFIDELVKVAASAPTRGNFMMASDIPAFKAPSLQAPVEKKAAFVMEEELRERGRREQEKKSDMLPDYISTDDGPSFKRSKYAAGRNTFYDYPENREKKKVRIMNGDHYQHLVDQARGDGVDRGEIVAEDGLPVTKEADISPTRPLGDGGGNPHRMQSWLASPKVNSLAAPLNKVAEDGGDYGGPAGFYYGSWQSGGGRGPVNEAGFRQASDQNSTPVNSLRAPLRKLGSLGVAPSPAAAKSIGKVPSLGGGTGPSIADIAKPKGLKFGGPLPGANKTTIGGYTPPSLK